MKTSTYTRFRRLAHSAALVLAAALLATACTDPADLADSSPCWDLHNFQGYARYQLRNTS